MGSTRDDHPDSGRPPASANDEISAAAFTRAAARARVDPDPAADGSSFTDTADDQYVDRLRARDRERRRRRMMQRRRRTILVASLAALVVAAVVVGVVWASGGFRDEPVAAPGTPSASPIGTPSETAEPSPPETSPTETTPAPGATGNAANIAIAGDIASASSLTVLVNKLTPLDPIDFVPGDLVGMESIGVPSMNGHSLRQAAAYAVQTMFDEASREGIDLDMTSGYRSQSSQTSLYEGYVSSLGQEAADATSARPGYSEHQTGLAADISSPNAGCTLEQCFAETVEGQWLADNAWRYGFILRYPNGATSITGYEFEPWHFRYVGVDVSTAMHNQGIRTYEEFLGMPAAPDYA